MTGTLARLVITVAVCASVSVGVAAQDTGSIRRLALDDYLEMESVSNPQISPDGTQIVYTRGWVDRVNDFRKSSLWIMRADGRGIAIWSRAATRDGRRTARASCTRPPASRVVRSCSFAGWTRKVQHCR